MSVSEHPMLAESANTIGILSEETINQIAAGELIDRPCSVVKELIENAIDAGSTVVMIDVVDGGKQLIRVSDDGEGIPPEDIRLAFERHATSKLRTVDDLWHVRTMGFRGEALPSISAVSKVKIRTMREGRKTGAELTLSNGLPGVLEETALSSGTIVEASDIFFNAPVRRKFLKTTPTEFGHICRTVQNQALSAPAIHVGLTHNGKRVSDFPAMSNMRDRVLQLFGAPFVNRCIEISKTLDGIAMWGMFARPEQVKTSRTPQEIVLNGRWIKSAMIVHAIYEAYRMRIPKDRYPTFAMTLDIDPTRVDVNVHPTKREVRFLDQEAIHHAIFHALKAGLGIVTNAPQVFSSSANVTASFSRGYGWGGSVGRTGIDEHDAARGTFHTTTETTENDVDPSVIAESVSQASPSLDRDSCDIRPLGQLNQTYIVANVDIGTWHGLKVLDQHTAHERVLFDRLLKQTRTRSVATQGLLFSPVVELQPSQAVVLNQHLEELRTLGLEIEQFGKHAFRIRAVPSFLTRTDVYVLLGEIADELIDGAEYEGSSSRDALDKKTHKVLATMACHGAIKANQTLGLGEMKHLIHDWVQTGMPTTCPHGRRIVMRLSVAELDRIFGRA
ncbi:MAG TPA: DNA mismatch repair endonuclease MutL [Nitrospirales bacterium]|nr:DNA mismatch repair endonuclease MutL [Nitrospirales bacterium]